ncbi:MAG: CHASE2 domain-containing protein [Acidobacteria bacterium]|nr:CHASE2 domain-containing protein [Acidobacteriota bacterium]
MWIGWRAPGLEISARDSLMRQRGLLQAPDNIVIVAIDETSLKRFGRFPWPRSLMARALDRLKDAQPKAIALDVLYVEPTNSSDDSALAAAIARAGNVVVAGQLTTETANEDAVNWLLPLPEIESNAAAVGHVDVHTGFDGVARTLMLREADDHANSFWAMAVELIRVGDGLTADAVRELPDAVALGKRVNPIITDPSLDLIESQGTRAEHLRAARLLIDYIGPTGSFAAQTFSFSEVVDGRVDPDNIRGKYVLIGATAATLGEKVASPLIHSLNRGRLRSDLMPGVEVLANQVNTILRERFFLNLPPWITFLCSVLVVLGVIIFAALAQGSYEIARQIAALGTLLALIIFGSYLAFSRWMILPPIVPMLLAFAIATPVTLLRRSFVLSREISSRIAELSHAGQSLLPSMSDRTQAAQPQLSASGEEPGASSLWRWPRGAEWRARELKGLNQELLQRALFVDRALRSVDDGLIIASTDARIVFANPRAAQILGRPEGALAGSDLFERISEAESTHTLQPSTLVYRLQAAQAARESLQLLLDSRQSIEREITLSSSSNNTRHYSLRISTVNDSVDGAVIGIVAAFTDITRHLELQRTQRDVMALVTHELKTPLTAIQGMSEVLARYEVETLKRREMHSTINEEAKRLARMIDEYLDLTRLESGVRQLRLLPMRVEQLLERALLLLDPVAESRGIKIIRNLDPALPPLLGDADLISRAVTNLVDNAIKFSPANSTIKGNTRADGSGVLIEVIDQGCGIAPEFQGQIFEKFYRVPRAANVDIPGTGLGLSLVREVAELHSGLVTVESQPGTGSVFSLYLGLTIRKGER